jgi:acetylornithine deacetylase/succinyl-diaminopimelate desuccinylase-like protein
MQQRVADAADRVGAQYHRMVSGAGHDAQVLAPVVPTGMIFVPSENGRSHSPVESTGPDQLEIGANVLLETLRGLAVDQAPG